MLYITYEDLNNSDPNDSGQSGIKKKVDGQIEVFKKIFGRVYYTCRSGQMFYLMEDMQIIDKELAITRKECNEILCAWVEKYKIRRTYVRYPFSDPWFLGFLQVQNQRKIRSVLEIPAYPYDNEGVVNGRIKAEDSYYRMQLCKYVELASTYSRDEMIWGIPCVPLVNGIAIEDFPMCMKEKEQNVVVLIGVAGLAIWHGYERVIEGMYRYYKKNGEYDLQLKIIGRGPEENYYKSLVKEYGLQSCVEFCGRLEGDSLNNQFEQADVAVGSLGLYKIGIEAISTLKGAEYCARGIPFILGYDDLRFSDEMPFIMSVPNDKRAVDMNKVIQFYERVTAQAGYHEAIRHYASGHLTWNSIMKPVVEYLKDVY